VYLCCLGRTALQQGDQEAARAAFRQVTLQARGRPRATSVGQVLVQALAGLTQAAEGPAPFEEALHLFGQRDGFNLRWGHGSSEDITLLELAGRPAPWGPRSKPVPFCNRPLMRARPKRSTRSRPDGPRMRRARWSLPLATRSDTGTGRAPGLATRTRWTSGDERE
jgi:hypothetical protein